jgi:hypothetical protein
MTAAIRASIPGILTTITKAKVCLSIIQAIAVNVVNKLVPGCVHDKAVHKDFSLSPLNEARSKGVIFVFIQTATPIILRDTRVIIGVNNGKMALS